MTTEEVYREAIKAYQTSVRMLVHERDVSEMAKGYLNGLGLGKEAEEAWAFAEDAVSRMEAHRAGS